eukprot:jgi/Astpho2/4153/fgenesh1_pg.00063_%23_126_t
MCRAKSKSWFGMSHCKDSIDESPDFWSRYEEDILNAKKLGCNSFRFSLEWARLEPKQGQIDQDAVKRQAPPHHPEANGMEPSVSLHHFVHPAWFDDLGGWGKEENVQLFAKFAEWSFQQFGMRAKLWATFNEPSVRRLIPTWQCKMFHFRRAGEVMLNVLKAHVAAYKAIKALPGGDKVQVGLTHAMWKFRTQGTGPLYWPAAWACHWATYCMGWNVIHQFMLTGKFEWSVPLLGRVLTYQNPGGRPGCDWWGIQYYSRPLMSWYLTPQVPPGERMSLMPYASDCEGLYECIQHSSKLGIPIYVSETGFPTHSDDDLATVLDRYTKEVLRAIKDGYDCRGIYIWTLVNNFEWAEGYTKPFGLYDWRPKRPDVDRKLKASMQALCLASCSGKALTITNVVHPLFGLQDGARVLIQYYKLLPDGVAAVKEMVKRIAFDHKPMYADIVAEAAHEAPAKQPLQLTAA